MTFPVNEQEFVERWLSALNEPDNADRALAVTMNRAYHAGREAGRREAGVIS